MSKNKAFGYGGNITKMLTGNGEMSERIRQFDWSQTSTGAIENWQQSLITAVNLILNSRFSMFVWWGEDLTYIYNDSYLPTLGTRHPSALGKSARDVWAEAWNVLGPQAEAVIEKGEASWNEELLLFLERHGFPEETYHTFSYSPIIDDFGKVGGLFCAVSEDTQKVLSRRRLQTLRDLGERTLEEAQTIEEACRVACETLIENPFDIPFAFIYLFESDGKTARLRESKIKSHKTKAPETIEIGNEQDVWGFESILESGRGQKISNVQEKVGKFSAGMWENDWTREAFIVPLAKSGVHNSPTGFLVCGISPRLKFDDDYRSFLELTAGHIATAIANAGALEEERKRAEALAEIDRAKTEFFSNVSHEFRTPLTLMLGNLEEVLAKSNQISSIEKEQIETAHRNSLRLLKLVNTLLDFSRIEAGRQQAVFTPVNLSEITTDLVSNFRSALENAGLTLKIDCPPLSSPIYIDREMWEKIVLNLLSNAFKFTFQGGIEVSLRERKSQVELKVKDSGVGIPENQLEEIFKRFHRVHQTEGRTFEGTGIGLSLVQELVRQHHGEITVESKLGKGTTFKISLPKGKAHLPSEHITDSSLQNSFAKVRADVFLNEITKTQNSQPQAQPQENNDSFSAVPLSQPQILLADDNSDMREYVQRLLEYDGYSVKTAADGQVALDILQDTSKKLPDLILSDVMMPRLNGFQLLENIRKNERTREIPIIMLSARAGEESKIEGLEAGADDYLVKPFSAKELLARVKTNLEMVKIRRETSQREAEILESVGDCFIALDNNYQIVYFNRCAEDYYNMKREDVLGKTLWEVFPIEQDSIFAQKYREALETKKAVRLEVTSIIKKGCWIDLDIYPSEKGLSLYFRDITKRKRAEEKLRESEERFRNMADNAPVMVWVTEPDGTCTYLSQSWYDFTGQTPETGLGFGWLEVVHPEDQKFSQDIFIAANEKHEAFQIEYRFRRKDGVYRWAIDSAQPRFGINGNFLGYIGSVFDITERKQAEEKLQASENQLRLITDSIPALVSYVDTDFRYRFVNQLYTDWFNLKPEDIVGKHISEIIGDEAYQIVLPKLNRALSGESITYEYLIPYKTAGERYVEVNLVADVDSKTKKSKGYFALIQDISERKRTAQDEKFLSNLSELIRISDDEDKFITTATELIGKYIGITRCFLAETDEKNNLALIKNDFHDGQTSIAGKYPLSAYPSEILSALQDGQICIISDTKNNSRTAGVFEGSYEPIGLRSFVSVPLRRFGRWAATFVAADDKPHVWENREVNLLETAAERFLMTVEKLRSEKILRESQAHLNLTTEAANIGTWQWDVKSNRIFWNEIQQRMWGYEPSDGSVDYSEGANLVVPEDMPIVESAIERCLRGEENYDIEYRIIPVGSKEIRWVRSTGKAIFNEAGETVSIQGISLDITKRKEQEDRLRESEALLQGSIDALTKHIAVLDWRGQIINVNAAWRRFAEENSFAGHNYGIGSNYVSECVPIVGNLADDCEMHGIEAATGIQSVLNEEKSYFEMEYPCHSPTENRWFIMRVTSFGTGEKLHVVVAHENVTARKVAELERERILESEQEARIQAENANRLKDEFLATVSHELRTPLNAILGWSAMARKNESDTKTIRRALEVIERSARNQNQIISDILEVSRIITGKLQLSLSPASLSQILQAAVDTMRPAIDAKSIELKINDDAEDIIINGDSDRLQQVFWNLLSNAVKFTSDEGTIEILLNKGNRFAEIIVKDNGTGIEGDFLPFVFDRFRQADGKMNRKHGGLGLGLAIVRHLTELHGGQVSVESEGLGLGSTFTVRLPLKLKETNSSKDRHKNSQNEIEETLESAKISLKKLASLRILVVDDEPNSLELALFILTQNGAKVFPAESVDEALKIFSSEKLDLLISDIGMPERDGYELIQEIKSGKNGLNQQIPTLALTAYAREEDERQLLQAGYQAYLPKPLEPSQLIEIVLELTSRN